MSDRTHQRDAIAAALKDFDTLAFPKTATRLFAALGYRISRHHPPPSEQTRFRARRSGKGHPHQGYPAHRGQDMKTVDQQIALDKHQTDVIIGIVEGKV